MTMLKNKQEYITLEKPVITEKNTLTCKFRVSPGLQPIFKDDKFVALYQDCDLTNVPESLSIIPALANLAPIAWAHNATLNVPVLDYTFFNSLKKVKESLIKMYPRISWDGRIQVESLIKTMEYQANRSALLFSGGVDSLASYVIHRNEKPVLISAIGGYKNSKEHKVRIKEISSFASRQGVKFFPVFTNMNILLNSKHLPFGGGWWWTRVRHGLAFLGLCAPLSYVEQLGKVYLASTHTKDSGIPWGSHPSIDNNVGWASTKAKHDGEHLSRQQKIEVLSNYVKVEDSEMQIRICYRGPNYANCSQCGKCYRTIIGLSIAGIDPNLHGFICDSTTIENVRNGLSKRIFLKDENNRDMWRDIQKNLPKDSTINIPGLTNFIAWFKGFKI